MSALVALRRVATLAVLAACSGSSSGAGSGPEVSPDAAATTDPFVGMWSCTGSSTTTFTAPPNTPPDVTSDSSTVTFTDDGTGNITGVHVTAGAPTCTLRSHLNADGKSTTLTPGQTCMTSLGNTLTYTMGGSTLDSPTTYTGTSSWTDSGKTTTGAALAGTGSGTSSCTKM
jgi:hypothetical protein